MVFPMFKIDIAFHIIFQVVRKWSHDQEIHRYAKYMASNLKINAEPEQPIAIEKDPNDEHTKRFKQIKSIPKDVRIGVL